VLPNYITKTSLKTFIANALKEDLGDGDHSSLAAIPKASLSTVKMLIKDDGIIAGIDLSIEIFNYLDPSVKIEAYKKDGEKVNKGDVIMLVSGNTQSLLSAERLVLNCVQRMSGIATHTHQLVQLLKGTKAQLLDTRKTTPNFRIIEKWAVSIGGGINHRLGLYDMIMLKDNHVDFAGGIEKAITAARKYLDKENKQLEIEIETRSLDEVKEVLNTGGVDIIMLDNMMPSTMQEAVKLIDGKYKVEASGGITEKNFREVAECGVDYISVGALTHSIKSLDISLKAM